MKAKRLTTFISALLIGGSALLFNACDFADLYITKEVYETEPPEIPESFEKTAILLFTKTNGFRHDSIEDAVVKVQEIAAENNWDVFHTENGAAFNKEDLNKFQVTVWLSTSGDILNAEQKQDFTDWLKNGGGFVGIHGAGGDPAFDGQWTWFVETIIGTIFIGHPMLPQFQDGVITIEDKNHPATRDLPDTWTTNEEWYSFDRNPRNGGFNILATVDENTYSPKIAMKSIAMGDDHPIIWHGCYEKSRTFYSALGHQSQSYEEPNMIKLITGAISWAARLEGEACGDLENEAGANGMEAEAKPAKKPVMLRDIDAKEMVIDTNGNDNYFEVHQVKSKSAE